jgi:hypothetical protein
VGEIFLTVVLTISVDCMCLPYVVCHSEYGHLNLYCSDELTYQLKNLPWFNDRKKIVAEEA